MTECNTHYAAQLDRGQQAGEAKFKLNHKLYFFLEKGNFGLLS